MPLTTASDAHTLPDVADRAGDLRDLLARGRGRPAAGVPRADAPTTSPWCAAGRGLTVATPAELAFERTDLDDVPAGPPPAPARDLGDPGRPVLLRPGAAGPGGARGPDPRRGEDGAGGPRADAPLQQRHRRPARPGRARRPATDQWPRGRAGHRVGGGDQGRDRCSSPDDEPVRIHCIPVRCQGDHGGRAGPTVGRRRTAPGPPRAHLPGPVRTLRRHAGRVDLPVPERGGGHRGGPPGRRRGRAGRRGGPGALRLAQRHQRPPPHGDVLPGRGQAPHRPGHRGVGHRMGAGLGPAGGRGGGATARRDGAAPLHPPGGRTTW